jgi:peptidoglycan/LPS O-acetylase OafA/YrhL
LSLVLLSYATAQFWPGVVLLRGLGFPYAGKSTLWLSDLLLLPVTLSLFCAVTNLNFPGRKLVAWIAVLIPVGMCVLLRTMGRLWENVPWTMSGVATIAAVSLLALRLDHWGEALFKLFRPLGKISYGLYLFHVPLAAFVSAAYPWTGGWANYAGGFLCWLAASLLVAWIFEARLQAYLLSFYKRRMASAGPKQA